MKQWDADIQIMGLLPQKMDSCLTTMDIFLQQPHPVVGSMVLAENKNHTDPNTKENIMGSVAHVMGIKDAKSINKNQTLAELGMDSLMSTEIKELLERNFNQIMTSREIRELTFAQIETMNTAKGNLIKLISFERNIKNSVQRFCKESTV